MKTILLISAFILSSCAQQVIKPHDPNVASDSMADGKVVAHVTKKLSKKEMCFDISLKMQDVEQKDIASSNWTAAWIDQDNKYHILALNQRIPASIPKGGPSEWSNNFKTCVATGKLGTVGSLLLTPKTLPFVETEGMTLQWK